MLGTVDRGLSQRWARKQIKRLFPSLGLIEFEEAWHGKIAMTPDHLPRIHELSDQLFTVIGYNGRGITTGTLFGSAMADLLTGMEKANLPLPITSMTPSRAAPLMSRVYQCAFTAKQVWKSL